MTGEELGMEEEADYGLTPRQEAQYETIEWISENFGKWGQGSDAEGAHYVAESPFAEEGLVCSNCVFFEGGRGCEVVDGDIDPNGICKLWIIRNELIQGAEPQMESEQELIQEPEMEEENMIEIRWATDQTEKRSIAFSNLEFRMDTDSNRFMGYAAMWDSPSEPLPWTEFVRRGAFSKTINDGADVRLLINHEGVPLARTKSGTMTLVEDERGLWVEADLDPANPMAATVISAMKRGDMTQMSFAFETIKDSWSDDRRTRELREVRLFDVSIVTYPAYEQTVAAIRSRIDTDSATVSTKPIALRKAQIDLAIRRAAR
jgi:HK97 family phage prohead protease